VTRPHHRKPGRRGPGLVLGAVLALALAPAAADARPPQITQAPTIAGTARVGATLEAQGAKWTGGRPSWEWMRCDELDADEGFGSCRPIPGATAITYTVTTADVGKYLRVLLVVQNRDGSAWALSQATAAVVEASSPSPSPEPTPPPAPPPSPQPSPIAPLPAPVVEVRDEQASAPRMMDPAPVVRIRGRLTRSGARITLLTVRAPRGARIAVRCFGRRCPVRRWARTSALTRVRRFQAAFPAGTRLVISVTKPRRIGKHTLIVIRRGKPPTRLDRCLMPDTRKPVACAGV
jgi:hypothetical protein